MYRVLFLLLFCYCMLINGRSSGKTCSFGEFQCRDGSCISNLFRCDRETDCADESDEENCDNYKGIKCGKNHFECKNQRCVSIFFRCDGDNDCGDNSDEIECENLKTSQELLNCTKEEFKCRDNLCIPLEDFCNKQLDCIDGSDEYEGCEAMLTQMPCSGFKCKDGMCISSHWRCDGKNDCPDNSDEFECEKLPVAIEECNNKLDRYLCKNSRCIPLNLTCNGRNDCGDGSDEGGDCKNVTMNCSNSSHNCEHFCRNTPHGPVCACRAGFSLKNNMCIDINECENYGVCSQICINTKGSYYCSCDHGYELRDDKMGCKVKGGEALLIFSSLTDIRGYYLNSKIYLHIAHNLQHAIGVSHDSKHVYWSDIDLEESVIKRSLDDGSYREMIVSAGLGTIEGLAVDWVTGNIYYTDSEYRRIGVCNNDVSYCTVIINDEMGQPRGITLQPSEGLMYWSSVSNKTNSAHISVAEMDGKGRKLFVTENLVWPNGLTIDNPNKRLYWVDGKLKTIESIRLDGTDRRTVLKDFVQNPYAIEVFEDKLYFSDWDTNGIHSCKKFTGKDYKTLFIEKTTVNGVHIYHSALKIKYENPCLTKPCSQLCLLAANRTYSCACTLNHELTYDKHTCKESLKQEHMIIAFRDKFIDYYHEFIGKPKVTESRNLMKIKALAYNSITDTLFVADELKNSLFNFNPHTGEIKKIMSIQGRYIMGMDFDYIGNNLYLSNTNSKSIEVYSMRTQVKFNIPFQHYPRQIVLVPEKGIMYVVFFLKSDYTFYIAKMDMAGLSNSNAHIIKENLHRDKISLAYDFEEQRLYYFEGDTGRIESISQNDDDRTSFFVSEFSVLRKLESLTILGDKIFWTQRESEKLFWGKKMHYNYKSKNLRFSNYLEVIHLVTLHKRGPSNHACSAPQDPCSHICIVNNTNGYVCKCPFGMSLKNDGKTCEQRACNSSEWRCSRTGHCIARTKRCDKKIDCPGEEDEIGCDANIHCSTTKFQCQNNECIDMKYHCDSNYDCIDESDEKNCPIKKCDKGQFQCHYDSECISETLVCNKQFDCTDFSDEIDCDLHVCSVDEFRCKESGYCIPIGWKCDGKKDCSDGSDEPRNCSALACDSSMFLCRNGHCVDTLLVCNDFDDCGDNSDEERCVNHKKVDAAICKRDQYKCIGTETCIPKKLRCNGFRDCPKGDDEENCVLCSRNEFKCDNEKCIDLSWVCDHRNDCGDNSDETNCDTHSRHAIISESNSGPCSEFQCRDGSCLDYSKCCDGFFNCKDLSDENGQCVTSCNETNPCEHVCIKTPNGPVCRCNDGYRLRDDKKTCEDINECDLKEKVCTHKCINTPGSYKCDCFQGYQLRSNGRSCKSVEGPPMTIISASDVDVRKVSANGNLIKIIMSSGTQDISGLDVNTATNTIYWNSRISGRISRYNLLTETRQDFYMENGHPDTFSLDWVTDNVYLYDVNPEYPTIKVCNIDQKSCAVLISIPLVDLVSAIAVDPVSGFLFWNQGRRDSSNSDIYRAEMTGVKVTSIVSKDVKKVTGIAIDHVRSRIYWSDMVKNLIEGCNFDGTDRQIVFRKDIRLPFYLCFYEDCLFWMDNIYGKIKSCSLFSDEPCTEIDLTDQFGHKFFTILQKSRQPPVENRCKNHNCEHMCVITAEGSACLCEKNETEFPISITGTCRSGGSVIDHGSKISYTVYALILIFGIIVLIAVIGFVGYKYYPRRRCPSIPFPSFWNRINNNREPRYQTHFCRDSDANSNEGNNEVQIEFQNRLFDNGHEEHQQLQQHQELEQLQEQNPINTPRKKVMPDNLQDNDSEETTSYQDDMHLIKE